MWEHFTFKKAWARSVVVDVEQGKTGEESPNKDLELLKHSSDLRFEGLSVRRAYYAGRSGDWESSLEFLKYGRLSV